MEKQERYRRKLEALQKISAFISSIHRLQELLTQIMEESKSILNAEASSLLLYDPKRRVLHFKVATGEKGRAVRTVELKPGQGIAGACAREKKIINVRDVSRDKRFFAQADQKSRFMTRSILAVPLTGRTGKLLGVLEVLNRRDGRPFDRQDEELMAMVAAQASLAVENAQLYQENIRNAKMAGVGETMLSLSHDIKNILNGLCGGIDMLDGAMETAPDPDTREAWGIVRENVDRIADLIMDMLNYSSKKKPLFEPFPLAEFITGTLAVYREKIRERRATLDYRFDPAVGEVDIDGAGMRRVLLNLVGNAWEALPEKGGRILVSTGRPQRAGSYLVRVEDNGRGIPPENLKTIFDIFFSTKGHQGTGLGLAVVRKIVAEHRGLVEVESKPGRGTAFILVLPENPARRGLRQTG